MAAANTYTPIATSTLGSATSTVTFSSIPSTYTDLVFEITNYTHSYSGTGGVYSGILQFNGDSGTNYSITLLEGNGSIAFSERQTNLVAISTNHSRVSDPAGISSFNIMNYANATTYKTVLVRSSPPGGTVTAAVGLWRSTAAITSITATLSSYTFNAGAVFSLYGILAA
jgi:hypothetical protein